MAIEAYPLTWPVYRPRTPRAERKVADFGKRDNNPSGGFRYKRALTIADAISRVHSEISAFTRTGRPWRINPNDVVISTNVPTTRAGLPYSTAKAPQDSGVAVYFTLDGEDYCLACDRWTRVADNLAAIAAHLGAMRGMERWGVGDLRQAFAGYAQLQGPVALSWRDVLDPADPVGSYRRLRSKAHPDRGGSDAEFAKVEAAWAEYEKEAGNHG
ncbi:J domain-containing protein [Luteimonas sp. TWI662]|uniref:J domain-containing protein n=1 Tax=Luteimonas sp. TWI662 TaxID=3136789 RepID=UPI003209F19C